MQVNLRVRQIRQSKGITQTFVAKQLGVTVQTFNSYEKGRTQLKVDTLKRIAEILDEPIENFFEQKLYETKKSNTA